MAKNFEYVIDHVGGFSKFQIRIVIAIFFQKFSAAWSMMQMALAGITPDFHCVTDVDTVAIADDVNKDSSQLWHNNESNDDSLNQCSVNGTSCLQYDFDISVKSVVNEWDLVCDLSWVKATMISVQMAGVLVGALLAGQLGDLFGRKKPMYGFYLLHCILNVLITFSNTWQMFMVFRFFIGMCIAGILVIYLPYSLEFAPENRRPLIVVIPIWACGVCTFALFAYLLEDWAHLHLACAAVSAPWLVGWFFVPESLRWLAVHGRKEEAYKVLQSMAKVNGKPLPGDTMDVIQEVAKEEKRTRESGRNYSYIDIFRGAGMIKATLSFGFMWVSFSFVIYGISFGISGLAGNPYLNMFILFVIDYPAVITTFFFSNRIGRRNTVALYFAIGTVAAFGALLTNVADSSKSASIVTTVFSFITKAVVEGAWIACQPWIVESYPTVTRNLGHAFCSTCARIGSIIAPFAINLDDRLVLSYILIGSFCLISTVLCLLNKDTKGIALAESIYTKGRQPRNLLRDRKDKEDKGDTESFPLEQL